jgi:guanylate kinase
MNKQKLIILTGKSSSGKDTLARMLEQKYGYNFIVSTTTRPMRPGESDKNPYNFVSDEKFQNLINNNELIEYREYHTLVNNNPETWYYGVEKKEVNPNKSYVVVLDIVGLQGFKANFEDKIVSLFINVSDEVRKNRCLSRGDFDEFEWNRRAEDDKIVFSEDVIKKEIDHVINGEQTIDEVLNNVVGIIKPWRN